MSNDMDGATYGAQLHLAISDQSRLPKEEQYTLTAPFAAQQWAKEASLCYSFSGHHDCLNLVHMNAVCR